jgi:hypothetical protein
VTDDAEREYRKNAEKLRRAREAMNEAKARGSSKVKEADTVKVPPMPNPQQYRAWRAAIRSQVTAASGRGEAAFQWVMQAEWHEIRYEMLQDSEGFDSLDAKLAAALTSTVSGELGRRITMAVENEAMRNRMLKGR